MSDRARSIAFAGLAAVVATAATLALATEHPLNPSSGKETDDHHASTLTPATGPAQAAFYADIGTANARMHAAMEIAPSGDIDRDFVQMMIPHHQGAIDMARLLLRDGHDERLRRLAQSIIVEQGQEIAYMRSLVDTLPPAELCTAGAPTADQ